MVLRAIQYGCVRTVKSNIVKYVQARSIAPQIGYIQIVLRRLYTVNKRPKLKSRHKLLQRATARFLAHSIALCQAACQD